MVDEEQVGIAASLVVNHGNDAKLQAAETRLKIATRNMRSAIADELQGKLNAAVSGITVALLDLSSQKDQLLKALAGRKTEYKRLGAAAAATAGGSAANRDKVAATMAAIPIVETVVTRARQISEASRPPRFDANAGRGLAMAQADKRATAADFLRACGELNHIHGRYAWTAREWELRLEQLNKVKRTLIGRRPKGRSE